MLYVEDIYEVLEKVLKIDPDDLAVCQRGPKLAKFWHVGVKNEEIWDRLDLSKHVGEIYRLRLGTEVQICKTFETSVVPGLRKIRHPFQKIRQFFLGY